METIFRYFRSLVRNDPSFLTVAGPPQSRRRPTFPLFSVIEYTSLMARPPRLPDAPILALIDELRAKHAVLTGTRLRQELKARHGMPCGVARIYRLLHQATQPQRPLAAPPTTPSPPGDLAPLQTELTAALERARLAEYREEAHQARWATEIHALREQVHALRDASHRLHTLEREVQDRSRELAAAYHRIADLEAQFR